jgi:predicted dehydrogenase
VASGRVRLGFIGGGRMAQVAHLRSYSKLAILGECELVALADLRLEHAREVGARYGVERVYNSHAEMLDKEQLDGVVAILPFDQHWAVLPDVYGRVKYVFTEKPVSVQADHGRELADLAARHGCVHMVGYHKRADLGTEWLVSRLRDESRVSEMGPVRYVRLTVPAGNWEGGEGHGSVLVGDGRIAGSPGEDAPSGMPEDAGRAYRSFVNYYIHQVNLARYLCGETFRVVYADATLRRCEEEVKTAAPALGLLCVGMSTSGARIVLEMAPYVTERTWDEEVFVAMEKGYARLRLPAPLARGQPGRVQWSQGVPGRCAPTVWEPVLPAVDAMEAQARRFVKVCRGEAPPLCGAAEAVEDLVVAEEYINAWHGAQTGPRCRS